MDDVDQESFSGVPNAVLDTNVGLTIYSWHDLLDALKALLDQDPNATLAHPALEFRRRRARNAFLLALFFHQNEWKALVPLNELLRILLVKAPPTGTEHGYKSNFVRLYLYFVKDKLLPGWEAGGDLNSDVTLKGSDVDRLCLDLAAQHQIPLISWEGDGPTGSDPTKLIPREARARGINLVTPEELLLRHSFDPVPAAARFFSDWERHVARYVSESSDARETLEYARPFYQRLAENDWTP
jgi:hypothetical protein